MSIGIARADAGCLAAVAAVVLIGFATRLARNRWESVIAYSSLDFLVESVRPNAFVERGRVAIGGAGAVLCVAAYFQPYAVVSGLKTNPGVALCIDTSGSMASTDIAPTRAQAVVSGVRAFVAALPADAHVGLITFATTAAVRLPSTAHRGDVLRVLARIPAPNGATAIGDALALARNGLGAPLDLVVLLTDGVSNRGRDPGKEAEALGVRGIRIYAVGIGKIHGDIIPGTEQRATIDPGALRAYARSAGGGFYQATSPHGIENALMAIAVRALSVRHRTELAFPFAAMGGTMLFLGTLGSFALGRVT